MCNYTMKPEKCLFPQITTPETTVIDNFVKLILSSISLVINLQIYAGFHSRIYEDSK